jgi:hypothetical protein
MKPGCDDRGRAAIAVITGVLDQLIIQTGEPRSDWNAVERFDDLLRPRVRQLSVAYQNAETSVVEIGFMYAGDAIDDLRKAKALVDFRIDPDFGACHSCRPI